MHSNHRIFQLALVGALFLGACSEAPQQNIPTTTMTETIRTTPAPPPEMASSTPESTESPEASGSPSGTPTASATPGASHTPSASSTPSTVKPGVVKLEPLPGAESAAPKITKVVKIHFKTDLGPIEMELYPEAAPNAAKRFEELVKSGFYDNTPIFRIVPGFVAQFGVNSDPKHVKMKEAQFNDDPSYFKLAPGTLAFAKAGPNTNSTQVFINYGDNSQLASPQGGNFTAFGKITKGLDEVAVKFKAVGDPQMGLDQGKLWEDTQGYLKSLPGDQKPNMIVKAEVAK